VVLTVFTRAFDVEAGPAVALNGEGWSVSKVERKDLSKK